MGSRLIGSGPVLYIVVLAIKFDGLQQCSDRSPFFLREVRIHLLIDALRGGQTGHFFLTGRTSRVGFVGPKPARKR